MLQILKQKSRRWFGARMPVADNIHLSQRSTYIWPTAAGYLAMIVTLLMMIGATNYQNNLAFLLTFLLVGIGLVSIIFTFKNLQGICFSLQPVAEVFCGQLFSVKVNLVSETGKPHFSIGVGFRKADCMLCDVEANGAASICLPIKADKRGYWNMPRFIATSQFPFGWLRTWAWFRFETPILVYPTPKQPPSTFKHADSGQADEDGSKAKGSDDLYGLKPYQPGESLSRVDWKAFSRERGLFVREFAGYQSQQLHFDWNDFPDCGIETRISYLTSLVLGAASQNASYSLGLPEQSIGQGDDDVHRRRCLRALALYGLAGHENSASGFSNG